VNTDDVLNILAAGKLDQNVDASWQEGDFNYDNRANTDDVLQILSAGVMDAGPYAREVGGVTSANLIGPFPGNAQLIYDPSNGNVKIDANGSPVSGFNLEDVLADGRDVFAGAQSPNFPPGGLSTTDTDTKVSWATVSERFDGIVDLGNIALPNLPIADLLAQLSGPPGQPNETYYTVAGVLGRQNFDVALFVPEPATIGMLGLAGVGLIGRRTRNRRCR
jgi:hypothetical protein